MLPPGAMAALHSCVQGWWPAASELPGVGAMCGVQPLADDGVLLHGCVGTAPYHGDPYAC